MKIETYSGIVRIQRKSGRSAKFHDARNMPLVRFESHKNPFLMIEQYCDNPECDCCEVGLEFSEIDESDAPLVNRIQFYFYLNLETWKENRKVKRSEICQRLVDEFVNNLTDEIKRKFKVDYEHIKKKTARAAKFDMPLDEIKKGILVPYSEVFGDSGSVLSGGSGYSFDFEYQKEKYYVDDMYCLDPACNCKTAHLVFLKYDKRTEVTSDIFTAKFDFGKGLEVEENLSIKKGDAIKIFDKWMESDNEAIDILKSRYRELKEIGKDLLEKHGVHKKLPEDSLLLVNNGKIGRNSPCPCGSGKKYKKCCGRL